MPRDEAEPIITFHEYPGGPPITFTERYLSDEWDPEQPRQRSLGTQWVLASGSAPQTVAPPVAHTLVSRELALAAARQVLFRYKHFDIEAPWHSKIPQRKAFIALHDPEARYQRAVRIVDDSLEPDVTALKNKIRFLEAELDSQAPHLQLYRLGAGSFLVAALSIVIWFLTGIGMPFHPIFAAGVVPVSVAVMAMAFLARPGKARSKE